MEKVPEYDRTMAPKAPRGFFICPFCGSIVKRRLSKVKNPDRVFCNNVCRGRFTEREKLQESMLTEPEFITEIKDPEVQRRGSISIRKAFSKYSAARKYEYSELWQEIYIAIWKFGKKALNGKGEKCAFYLSCFDYALLNFFHKNDWTVEELSLCDVEPIYSPPEGIDIMGKVLLHEIETKSVKKKNWAWFREYYIDGNPSSVIAEKYGADMREVTCAISYLKKTLRKKYLEAV